MRAWISDCEALCRQWAAAFGHVSDSFRARCQRSWSRAQYASLPGWEANRHDGGSRGLAHQIPPTAGVETGVAAGQRTLVANDSAHPSLVLQP